MGIGSHPQRDAIWEELHARPYVRFSGPAHVLHLSFFLGEGGNDPDRPNLLRLKEKLGLAATYDTPKHGIFTATIARFGRLVLSWERHTEFVAYTFFLYELEIPFRPFGFDFTELVPAGWLESFGTFPLVATRLASGGAVAIASAESVCISNPEESKAQLRARGRSLSGSKHGN